MADIELTVENEGILYQPEIEGDITWTTERKGVPGKLEFTVVKDGVINYQEGNHVCFRVDGQEVFYGFVFAKKRSCDGLIQTTAYDQLRYLKNKDTYVYENKTADEVIRMLAGDFCLQCGDLEPAGFKIASRIEENKTLFDMIQNALDITLQNTGKLFVLYDAFGKLTLRDAASMRVDLLIDSETAQDFDYSTGIDGETYNKIKLYYENKDAGRREIYIAQDGAAVNAWGVLQHFDQLNDGENGKAKADALLSLYDQKTRSLSVSNAFGDIRVRAGTSVAVSLDLGDVTANTYMLAETAKHRINNDEHCMDLTFRGGGLIG